MLNSIKRVIKIIIKFELSLNHEALLLKLLIKSEIIISREAIDGAEGKINKPVLNILISFVRMYLNLRYLLLCISRGFIREIYQN